MTAIALLRWSGAICICTAVPSTFPSFLFFRMRLTRLFDPAIVDRMSCFAALGHVYLPEARVQGEGFVYAAIAERKEAWACVAFRKATPRLEREACFRDPIIESEAFLGN